MVRRAATVCTALVVTAVAVMLGGALPAQEGAGTVGRTRAVGPFDVTPLELEARTLIPHVAFSAEGDRLWLVTGDEGRVLRYSVPDLRLTAETTIGERCSQFCLTSRGPVVLAGRNTLHRLDAETLETTAVIEVDRPQRLLGSPREADAWVAASGLFRVGADDAELVEGCPVDEQGRPLSWDARTALVAPGVFGRRHGNDWVLHELQDDGRLRELHRVGDAPHHGLSSGRHMLHESEDDDPHMSSTGRPLKRFVVRDLVADGRPTAAFLSARQPEFLAVDTARERILTGDDFDHLVVRDMSGHVLGQAALPGEGGNIEAADLHPTGEHAAFIVRDRRTRAPRLFWVDVPTSDAAVADGGSTGPGLLARRWVDDVTVSSPILPTERNEDTQAALWTADGDALLVLFDRRIVRVDVRAWTDPIALELPDPATHMAMTSEGLVVHLRNGHGLWLLDPDTLEQTGRIPVPGCMNLLGSQALDHVFVRWARDRLTIVDVAEARITEQLDAPQWWDDHYYDDPPQPGTGRLNDWGEMALSPDGRHVVLTTGGRLHRLSVNVTGGRVRLRHDGEGPEGRFAGRPLVSSDSRYVALTAGPMDVIDHPPFTRHGLYVWTMDDFDVPVLARELDDDSVDALSRPAALLVGGGRSTHLRLRLPDGAPAAEYVLPGVQRVEDRHVDPAGRHVALVLHGGVQIARLPAEPVDPGDDWIRGGGTAGVPEPGSPLLRERREVDGAVVRALEWSVSSSAEGVAWSPDGTAFTLAYTNGRVCRIAADDLTVQAVTELDTSCSRLAACADGLLVVCDELQEVRRLDPVTLETEAVVAVAGASDVTAGVHGSAAVVSGDEREVLTVLDTSDMTIASEMTLDTLRTGAVEDDVRMPAGALRPGSLRDITVTPDGRFLLASGAGSVVRVDLADATSPRIAECGPNISARRHAPVPTADGRHAAVLVSNTSRVPGHPDVPAGVICYAVDALRVPAAVLGRDAGGLRTVALDSRARLVLALTSDGGILGLSPGADPAGPWNVLPRNARPVALMSCPGRAGRVLVRSTAELALVDLPVTERGAPDAAWLEDEAAAAVRDSAYSGVPMETGRELLDAGTPAEACVRHTLALPGGYRLVDAPVFAPDGDALYVAHAGGDVRRIRVPDFVEEHRQVLARPIQAMGLTAAGLVVAASNPPELLVLDAEDLSIRGRIGPVSVSALATSPGSSVGFAVPLRDRSNLIRFDAAAFEFPGITYGHDLAEDFAGARRHETARRLRNWGSPVLLAEGRVLLALDGGTVHKFSVTDEGLTYEAASAHLGARWMHAGPDPGRVLVPLGGSRSVLPGAIDGAAVVLDTSAIEADPTVIIDRIRFVLSASLVSDGRIITHGEWQHLVVLDEDGSLIAGHTFGDLPVNGRHTIAHPGGAGVLASRGEALLWIRWTD